MTENSEKLGNFGWRYFHFIDTSGSRINIVEHKTDIFGLENKPYISMIAKNPKNEPLRNRTRPKCIIKRQF